MATSKLNARRPTSRGTADSRDRTPAAPAKVAAPDTTMSLDLAPSGFMEQAIAFRDRATALIVRDKDSHEEALTLIREGKQIKRGAQESWQKPKRKLDEWKRIVLDLERKDLAPVDAGLETAEARVVAFVNDEDRRRRAEEDRIRRENEERARQDRERELVAQEEEAARIEAQSPALSARETVYVNMVVLGSDTVKAAKMAGYKDPPEAAGKLRVTQKIIDAIASRQAALAIREQAEAQSRQPLVVEAPKVESNLGKVSGTRMITTFSCEVFDANALRTAVIQGSADRRALTPDLTYLSRQAKDLRESFESAFPGCRLVKSQGVAG